MAATLTQLLSALIFIVLLSGCGSRIDSMQETIGYAVFGKPDVTLSAEEIAEQSFPLQYLTLGEQSRITLGLGFDDKGLYKWLSGSQEVMVTKNGRIVQTQGLVAQGQQQDLEWVSDLDHDPLACITAGGSDCAQRWSAEVQLGSGLNSRTLRVNSLFSPRSIETLRAPDGTQLSVQRWQEHVTSGDHSWSNWYWVEQQTHRVVKSEQQLSLSFPRAHSEEIKPYVRDLNAGEAPQ
ncbi:YjbF family lipoprotein [Idiomarina seosinensis]|uniref:YjbF family lipoprotein n=1 Tax=Idiomarina seosinensis TaxID=281739 RepID=UPI00384C35A8